MLVAAATGVFYQTAGAHIDFVTVRGEHATYQGSGLYWYDPASVAREGVVWDVIDLCLALPLFAAAIVLSQRNSLRGRLLLGGMFFYFFYKYMQYAVMVAFNPLFLVYVAIFALSAVAFFLCCCAWWGFTWPGDFSGVCRRKKFAQVAKWRTYDC